MSSRTHLVLRLSALALLAGAFAWPRPAPKHELDRDLARASSPRHAEVIVAAADRARVNN